MAALARRLLQLAHDAKLIEAARGYNDSHGQRQPGAADELERLLIIYGLADSGFTIPQGDGAEELVASIKPGSRTWIDEAELLAHGVDPDIIVAARKTSRWTSVQVVKRKAGESPDD